MEQQYGPLDQRPVPDGTPEEQLLDDVLDRPAGEDYNPNPPDVVEQNRARFDAMNHELQQTREEVERSWSSENERFLEEAEQAEENPEHQAVIPHQQEHAQTDPLAEYAGQEREVSDDTSPGSTYDDPNMRPAEHPGSPVDPDRFLQPPIV